MTLKSLWDSFNFLPDSVWVEWSITGAMLEYSGEKFNGIVKYNGDDLVRHFDVARDNTQAIRIHIVL